MEQNLSYRADLWDSFETVVERVKNGTVFCKAYMKFFGEFVKETREYSKKLIALTKTHQEDIGTTNLGWTGMKQEIESLANIYIRFSDDIESKVITPVDNHLKDTNRSKRKGKEKGRALVDLYNNHLKLIQTEKAEYDKGMRAADESKTDYDRSLNFPEVSNSSKLKKKLDADQKKTESLERKYKRAIEKSRVAENKLFDTVMPEILAEFEVIERKRLYSIKSGIDGFRASIQDTIAPIDILSQRIVQTVESINPDDDVQTFIMEKKSGKLKETQRIQFEPFNPDYNALESGTQMSYASFTAEQNNTNAKSGNSSFSVAYINATKKTSSSQMYQSQGMIQSPNSPMGYQAMPSPYMSNQTIPQVPNSQFLIHTPPNMQINQQQPIVRAMPSPQMLQSQSSLSSIADPMEVRLSKVISKKGIGFCKGLFDYNSLQPSELTFKKGDVITLYEKDASGWWIGELNGKVGFFPSVDWVEEILPPLPSPQNTISNSNLSISSNSNNNLSNSSNTNNGIVISKERKGVCKALFSLSSTTTPNQLTFREGEIMTIEGEVEGGWFFGKNQSGQSGLFPANLVSILS